ncbi:hypothetical protein ANN_27349 [Periplaneta americana]|uniref:Uncharacterized protein n=1 Tax=Periplaneta americana TaxID=6978 RepID=A0ABQ8RXY3_PERAM|nr:hypothetical protein ANN_27349 [Periplaneta americana]
MVGDQVSTEDVAKQRPVALQDPLGQGWSDVQGRFRVATANSSYAKAQDAYDELNCRCQTGLNGAERSTRLVACSGVSTDISKFKLRSSSTTGIGAYNSDTTALDNYIFIPFAVETFGPWSHDAKVLVSQIGQILISITGDRRCTTYLRQRLSISIQRGNAMSVLGTLPESSPLDELFLLQLKRIEAAEMRLLRPLAGYTLYDHKYNEDIRQELNIAAITQTIHKYRSNWHEHDLRMPNDRLPRRLLNYRPLDTEIVDARRSDGETSFSPETEQA